MQRGIECEALCRKKHAESHLLGLFQQFSPDELFGLTVPTAVDIKWAPILEFG